MLKTVRIGNRSSLSHILGVSFIVHSQYMSTELNLTFYLDLMCFEPANNKEMKHLLGTRCYAEPFYKLSHVTFTRGCSYFPHFANEET